MIRINKVYTRTGDQGETGLGDGSRRKKTDVRVTAYGSADELNASIGLAVCHAEDHSRKELLQIQNDLFDLGADLCVPEDAPDRATRLRLTQPYIDRLESWIDAHNDSLTPLRSFILPGGSLYAGVLHVARTVARRAERDCIRLAEQEEMNALCLVYLNRLSDYLFVLARKANNNGETDILWQPGQDPA